MQVEEVDLKGLVSTNLAGGMRTRPRAVQCAVFCIA